MIKSSFYNLLIPVPETNEFLLYNGLHGGLVVLNKAEGELIGKILQQKEIDIADYVSSTFLNELIEKNYLVESDKDEISLYRDQCRLRTERVFYKNPHPAIVFTIATTNACNMACPYCYEFKKTNARISDENIDRLVLFLDSILKNSGEKQFSGIGVTWYGGEPLLATNVIEKGTFKLMDWAERRGVEYRAEMITNGLLLTDKNWQLIRDSKVKWLQVTIDGNKSTHEKNRPLKYDDGKNYERILENISRKPDDIKVTIRVNFDKEVFQGFPLFLSDLEKYGIWPQKYTSINVQPAICRTYEENHEKDLAHRIPFSEWSKYYQAVRKLKFEYFNEWALKNNVQQAKYIYHRYTPSYEECWSVVSPFIFVIDADGYTHKCWELVHDENTRIQHISEEYDINKYNKHLSYSKFDISERCDFCKYLPICGILSCTQHQNEVKDCPYKDKRIEDEIRNEYLLLMNNPNKVVMSREKKEDFVRP